jgi:hypothetical protein
MVAKRIMTTLPVRFDYNWDLYAGVQMLCYSGKQVVLSFNEYSDLATTGELAVYVTFGTPHGITDGLCYGLADKISVVNLT